MAMNMDNKEVNISKNVAWIDANILFKDYDSLSNHIIGLVGWIKSNRNNGSVGFISFHDGTSFQQIQIVYKKQLVNFDEIKKLNTGCSISVIGKITITPDSSQKFEIQAIEIKILKKISENYPIQKKNHSDDFLRQNSHLRIRTNKYYSVMKMRSELAYSIHLFFKNNGFIYLHSPIITNIDPEGAGEAFELKDNIIDPYWPKKALLTVSGQFAAEAYAQAFRRVYTFGPTFRAEKSHTSRHLAEFWMVEPEIAFMNLAQLMDFMENFIKHSIVYMIKYTFEEIKFCNEHIDKNLLEKLNYVVKNDFKKVDYTNAIKILKNAVKLQKDIFENSNIYWGMDLNSEHERYLCENAFEVPTPIFVYNFPKHSKAFYMKLNDDNKTVAAVDLLVPTVGELCGGSQREDDKQKLINRCLELKMDTEQLKWYLKLRDYGYYRSSGFGLGFDRLLMFITGVNNLRDVIPFPRSHGLLDF